MTIPDTPRERALFVMNKAEELIEACNDVVPLLEQTYTSGLGSGGPGTPSSSEIAQAVRTLTVHLGRLKARAGVHLLAQSIDPSNPDKQAVLRVVR